MRRRFAKLLATTAAVSITASVATSDDPAATLKICTIVPLRLARDSFTATTIAFDYQYSLRGLEGGTPEYEKAKHEVHTRSARRLQQLCFRNGGIYIKLGQHIAQLDYVVPPEYLYTFRASMLKRCPVSSYSQVCKVFQKELGKLPDDVFAEFDKFPLASASLAQVHAATMHDGTKFAVKVQHVHLTDTAAADYATVGFIVNFLHRCLPSFDYRWLIDEMHESGPKASRRKPQLILLDHGLYKELDVSMRTNYAALWKALIFADANAIKENSVKLGAGEDLYALFAGILTMRPWNRVVDPAVDHLVVSGNDDDRSELQGYASQYFRQISELLRRLPRVILLMLKTNDCLRAVNKCLLPEYSLETFLITARVSAEAVAEIKREIMRAGNKLRKQVAVPVGSSESSSVIF